MDSTYEKMLCGYDIEINSIAKLINSDPLDQRAKYLTAYAALQGSAAIESTLKQMVYDWLSKGSNYDARNYFKKNILEYSRNPKSRALIKMLGMFNNQKQNKLLTIFKNNDKDKLELDSLVETRNRVSHGGSLTVGINEIIDQYKAGKRVIRVFYDILTGKRT